MKTVAARDLWVGAKVSTVEDGLWGAHWEVNEVTDLFCELDSHLVEAQLRSGQVLKRILRMSDDTEVEVIA